METLGQREQDFKIKFEKVFPNFEYISGYINCDSPFISKCRTCGHLQERNANCIRHPNRKLKCNNCIKVNKQNRTPKRYIPTVESKERAQQRKRGRRKAKLLAPIKCSKCGRLFVREHGNQTLCKDCAPTSKRLKLLAKQIPCKECGRLFTRTHGSQLYCSDVCKEKAGRRHDGIRRRKKLRENGKIEWDISLRRLIERDNSVCQLCGKKINLNDFTIDNEGNFIAGDAYPSIDHIMPVSKGGTHTWDNVQLAHMRCNYLKSDKILA